MRTLLGLMLSFATMPAFAAERFQCSFPTECVAPEDCRSTTFDIGLTGDGRGNWQLDTDAGPIGGREITAPGLPSQRSFLFPPRKGDPDARFLSFATDGTAVVTGHVTTADRLSAVTYLGTCQRDG